MCTDRQELSCFLKEDVNVTVTPFAREYSDLPTLTCVIEMGKERKTIVNFTKFLQGYRVSRSQGSKRVIEETGSGY